MNIYIHKSAENYKVFCNINILLKVKNSTIVMTKKMFLINSRVARKFSTKSHIKQ